MKSITLSIICVALLWSCSERPSSNSSTSVFKYNQHTGITSLDPAFSKDQATMWACNQIYDGLVSVNESLEVVPAVAESWELSADGKTYTFRLKEGIRFHDHDLFDGGEGRAVTAADFVYSFNRLISEEVASPGAWLLRGKVVGEKPFEALDERTLIIRLQVPYRPFLSVLTLQYFSVVPHEVVEAYGKDFRMHPVGCGPFQLNIWEENNVLLLSRNPNYYERDGNGQALPYLDGVRVSFIGDRQSEFEEFRQGKLHFVSGIDAAFKDRALTADGELHPDLADQARLEKAPYLNTEYLGISMGNQEVEALRNKLVRQAINYGFDREKMIRFLRNGIGSPAHAGMIPEGLPAHDPEKVIGYRYDPDRARKLMNEAGYPGGEGIGEIKLHTNSGYKDLTTFIAKSLQDIGLDVQLELTDASLQRELMRRNEVDFFRASWIGDFPDGENYLALFYGGYDAPPNYTSFRNDRFDELYEAAVREADPDKYIPMYREMEQIVLDESPVVPLYYDQVVRFIDNRVEGLPSNAMNLLDLTRVRINP